MPSSQVLNILEYACGLILGHALISNENPNFDVASMVAFRFDAETEGIRFGRYSDICLCRPGVKNAILA